MLRKTGAMKMTKMTGKMMMNNLTLNDLFTQQMTNQKKLICNGIYNHYKERATKTVPVDDISLASYHLQQLMSEIGEVLQADKRWKSFRNETHDKKGKLEELADCFIVLMNVAMFSGYDGNEVTDAIEQKIRIVSDRINGL